MSERYKLGLTRNRLFEFDNSVLFYGKPENDFDYPELDKALKMLCLKEPLITSKIELTDNAEAFAVTQSVKLKIDKVDKTHSELLLDYEQKGIDFSDELFHFSVSSDGYLVIAGHTAVCDAKSLLRLAVGLSEFYNKVSVSAEPSVVNLFSEFTDLPVEVASPITDKLSAELDSKWVGKSCVYSVEDYKNARALYIQNRSAVGELRDTIDCELLSTLQSYCLENDSDVSSVVAFSFYEALLKNIDGKKKYNKMNVYADNRFFFEDFKNCGVGAFNGVITADLNKKECQKSLDERVKLFHLDCYKGVTSPFRVFYDDSLLMKLSPSLCDSSYMYKAGLNKLKLSGKVADNYGCANEKICDFFSCNMEQEFWHGLDTFGVADVSEPLKMRSSTYLSFIRRNKKGYITFKYKKDKCSDSQAKGIMNDALELLNLIAFSPKHTENYKKTK